MLTRHLWAGVDDSGDRKLSVTIRGRRGLPFIWGHALQCSMRADDASGIFDWSGLGSSARVIRYDARAHGESCGEREARACAWPSLARDMWRVADACGVRRAVLGGASMGCATALWAALQDPARTAALVLVIPPTAWELRPRQARSYLLMARLVRLAGRLPFRAASLLLGEREPGTPLRAIAHAVVRELAARDPRDVETAFRGAALSDLPSLKRCATLTMPALVLAWPDDRAHPLQVATRLAKAMPQARLLVAADLDAVRGWPAEVKGFLESVRA